MDAHNTVMRDIRAKKEKHYDPHEPTRVWLDEDNTPDGVYQSLTIILNTGGCRWARAGGCTMCGYVAESVEGGSVTHEPLMDQIQVCLDHERENADEQAASSKSTPPGPSSTSARSAPRRDGPSRRRSPTASASSSRRCRTSSRAEKLRGLHAASVSKRTSPSDWRRRPTASATTA